MVRLKPNTNSLFNDELDKKAFKKEIEKQDWAYDIPGCCSIKTLRHIIANDYLLPQNALLNGKTKMDAENYYIQTGSLIKIDQLITDLKTLN